MKLDAALDARASRPVTACRQRRLAELSASASTPHFGTIRQIDKAQFVAEVTQASEDVWVVVHLYKDKCALALQLPTGLVQPAAPNLARRIGDCGLLAQCLETLAREHSRTKFVRIISTECIPNYPDQNLPTILLYRRTQLQQHLVGLGLYGGRNTTAEGKLLLHCLSASHTQQLTPACCVQACRTPSTSSGTCACRRCDAQGPLWTLSAQSHGVQLALQAL